MDDAKLIKISESLLDGLGELEGQCHFSYGEPFPLLTLDRNGCIALAASLLDLAAKPLADDEPHGVDGQLHKLRQVYQGKTDFELFQLRRLALIPQVELNVSHAGPSRLRDRVYLVGCGTFAFLCVMLMLTGVFAWVSILFGMRPWIGSLDALFSP